MHDQCDATDLLVTFPAAGHHCPLTGTKLYCLVTEAQVCEQLVQGCYQKAKRPRLEPATLQKGREYHTLFRIVYGVLVSLNLASEPVAVWVNIPPESLIHSQCDVTPTVAF